MGTNYYYGKHKKYHIGKKSSGWEFIFEAQPELDVYSKPQWGNFLFDNVPLKGNIIDEYGTELTFDEFFNMVNDSKGINHFDYMQEDEFKTLRSTRESHGIPFMDIKIKEIQPRNTWKDSCGYAVILGEFS